ncbi:MAG: glycine betaine/L-proline ABC transporter ATP-binding protein [Alphaproteobacteria bacterium]|nr:glycine betaine/L-proline ABC transporter ATP-binding protein [Alphaproteobacteria bacterium]
MVTAFRNTGVPPMTKSDTTIEIRDLYKIFGATPAKFVGAVKSGMSKAELGKDHGHILGLNNINISMPAGKIQVVMGLSGSGKSTLIRHINRLIEPTSGSIMIDGRNILEMPPLELRDFRRQHTAMVFQRFALLPHRTVIDNVTFGLEIRGVEKAKARESGMRWIERVGLQGFENRYPSELSGGMQQRVGLARALSNDASILLMDEAYSALDPLIRTDMQSMLLDLQAELKKTIVFITHDLDEALRLGDKIVILRDGSIIQQGNSQDILLNPADDYIQRFIKDVNRGRFLKVEAVMEALPATGLGSLPSVKSGTTLEVAAKELTASPHDSAIVADAAGKPLGLISLRQITAALSSAVEASAP